MGYKFDSKWEAERYGQLASMQMAGVVEDLERQVKFDIIVNCAAYTDLIYCEKNYQKILKINTFLPIFLSSLSLVILIAL